jgi:hypothetical protein
MNNETYYQRNHDEHFGYENYDQYGDYSLGSANEVELESFMEKVDQALASQPMKDKQETKNEIRWTPATDMLIDNTHPHLRAQPFLALYDPGSSNTLINRRSIPTGMKIIVNGTTTSTTAHSKRTNASTGHLLSSTCNYKKNNRAYCCYHNGFTDSAI